MNTNESQSTTDSAAQGEADKNNAELPTPPQSPPSKMSMKRLKTFLHLQRQSPPASHLSSPTVAAAAAVAAAVVEVNNTNYTPTPHKRDRDGTVDDLADLMDLNQSTVLQELKQRYQRDLIYTYSGLFLLAINPWKSMDNHTGSNLYTEATVMAYRGRQRHEMPPHIYAVCDDAYRSMLEHRSNQTVLVTGESGSGKTENTRRVIQYLTKTAARHQPHTDNSLAATATHHQLEEQILQANPILEAFGNAKTIRNNNSSRFGKFVRLQFNASNGWISGANFEHYLLEKGRVTQHHRQERSFHIFYQLLAGSTDSMHTKYRLLNNASDYRYLNCGALSIEGLNDGVELERTISAMQTIGFSPIDLDSVWRLVSAILLLGNLEFQNSNDGDHASFEGIEQSERNARSISELLRVDYEQFCDALLRPTLQAGGSTVSTAATVSKAAAAANALAKGLYERLFRWLVTRINHNLAAAHASFNSSSAATTTTTNSLFIGVLDIAGFEIFEENSLEQLCINLTNEKLQQFFNHRMFILEQQVYQSEGIQWDMIDFGLDLQPTIDLIEQPLGIMSILDEECLFPRATDESFVSKLIQQHEGKSQQFESVRFSPQSFVCSHYAGKVQYSTEGWLLKNKDPMPDDLGRLLAGSLDALAKSLYSDYDPTTITGDIFTTVTASGDQYRKKGSQFVTVSHRYRWQLNELMRQLHRTTPHFVRCLLPNDHKQPGVIEDDRLVEQLRCNGVLEGLRIARLGFPARLTYQDFCQRYKIFAPTAATAFGSDIHSSVQRSAAAQILESIPVHVDSYKLGKTMVLLKDGALVQIEEQWADRLSTILVRFQAHIRGYLTRRRLEWQKLVSLHAGRIQRHFRAIRQLRTDRWWQLFLTVRPMLAIVAQERQTRNLQAELNVLRSQIAAEREEQASKQRTLMEQMVKLREERDELSETLEETVLSLNRLEDDFNSTKHRSMHLENCLTSVEQDRDRLRLELASKADLSAEIVDQLRQERDRLASQLCDSQDQQVQLQSSAETMQDFLVQNEKHLLALQQRLDSTEQALQLQQKKTKTLEQSSSSALDESIRLLSVTQDLELQLARKSSELKSLQSDNRTLRSSLDEARSKQTALAEELKQKRERLQSGESDRFQVGTQLRQLQEENRNLQLELEDGQAEVVKLRGILASKTTELSAISKQHASELEERENELQSVRRQLQLQESKYSQQTERNSSTTKQLQSTIQSMEDRLREINQQLSAVEQSRLELTRENRRLLQEKKIAEQESQSTQAKLSQKLEESAAQFLRQSTEWKAEIAALEERLRQRTIGDAHEFEQRLDALQSELHQVMSSKTALEKDRDRLQVELDQSREQLSGKQHELYALQKQLKSNDGRMQELAATVKERDQIAAQLDEMRQERDQLAKDYEQCKSAAQSLDEASQQVMEHVQSLQQQLERAEEGRKQLLEADRKHRKQHGEITNELVTAREELAVAETDKSQSLALLEQCKSQMDQLSVDNQALRDQLSAVNQELEVLKMDAVKGGEERLAELGAKLAAADRLVFQMRSEREEVELELQSTMRQLEAAQSELNVVRDRFTAQLQETSRRSESVQERQQQLINDMRAELERSEQRLASNEDDRLQLESQLQSAKDQEKNYAELQADYESFRRQADCLTAQMSQDLEQWQKEAESTQQLLITSQKRTIELEEQISGSQTELFRLQKCLDDSDRDKEELKIQLSAAANTNEVQRDTELRLQKTIGTLTEQLTQEQNRLIQLQSDMDRLESSTEEQIKRLRMEWAEEEQSLRKQLYSTRREHDQTLAQLRDQSDSVRREQATVRSLKSENQALSEKLSETQMALDRQSMQYKSATQELGSLKIRFSSLTTQYQDRQQQMEELERKFKSSFDQLQSERRQSIELQSVNKIQLSQLREAEQESESAHQKLTELRKQYTANSQALKDAQSQMTELVGELEKCKEQERQMRLQYETEVDEMRMRMMEVEKTNHLLESTLGQTLEEYESYRQERSALVNQLCEEREKIEQTANSLKARYSELEKIHKNTSIQLEELQQEHKRTTDELETRSLKFSELSVNFESMFLRKQEVEQELLAEQERMASQTQDCNRLQMENDRMRKVLKEMDESIRQAETRKSDYRKLQSALVESQAEISRLLEVEQKQRGLMASSQRELYRLNDAIDELKAEKASLHRENQDLSIRLQQMQDELDRKHRKAQRRLEDQIEELSSQLQRETGEKSALSVENRALATNLKHINALTDRRDSLNEQSKAISAEMARLKAQLLAAEERADLADLARRRAEQDKENERMRVFATYLSGPRNSVG